MPVRRRYVSAHGCPAQTPVQIEPQCKSKGGKSSRTSHQRLAGVQIDSTVYLAYPLTVAILGPELTDILIMICPAIQSINGRLDQFPLFIVLGPCSLLATIQKTKELH
jgi:hypothetical protein